MRATVAGALLLAAAPVAAVPSRADDLAGAVEPVDYVQVCDAYGAGFLTVPGTQTCLRLSARVRVDANGYLTPKDDLLDAIGLAPPDRQSYRLRARGNVYLDSRSATEWGLLRTFIEYEFTTDSLGTGDGAPPTAPSLENAFLAYGGFTFGRAQSFYDFLDIEYAASQTFDAGYSDTVQNVLAYTRRFGALSATLSLEDASERQYRIAEGRYGGTQVPDVVAVLRYADALGSAQVMAAAHSVNAVADVVPRNPGKGLLRVTDEAYGFAVGGGASLSVPVGNGTTVGATASYARGALAYLAADIQGQLGVFDAAFGPAAGRPTARSLSLSDGVSVGGGFATTFAPRLGLGVNLGVTVVDVPDAATDVNGDGRHDDFDVANYDAQAFLGYEPAADVVLGVGAEYRLIDTQGFEDASVLTGFVRVQRTF